MQHHAIVFIGAGNIARALIAGLIAAGYPAALICATAPSPQRREALAKAYGIATQADNLVAAQKAQVVVFAVKPQSIAAVAQSLQPLDFSDKLLLSLVTGVTIERYGQLLSKAVKVIRVMPNTPALIGQGMTGLYAPPTVSKAQRQWVEQLLQTVGKTCWVEQEAAINRVIAAAGSAPAYFFLIMEAMVQEATQMGSDVATARLMVTQAALGAAQMAMNTPQLSLATLREQITSKGGTTAAALQVFEQQQLSKIIAEAMQAAVSRAEEIESS